MGRDVGDGAGRPTAEVLAVAARRRPVGGERPHPIRGDPLERQSQRTDAAVVVGDPEGFVARRRPVAPPAPGKRSLSWPPARAR